MIRRMSLLQFVGCAAFVLATSQNMLADAAMKKTVEGTRQDSTNDLSVITGRSVLLDCAQPVQRVAIGLSGIAEAVAVTPTEIMVNGKAPGETTLILWEKGGGREFFNVSVKASKAGDNERIDSVRRELGRELPGQPLKVSFDGGSVFLSGTAEDLGSAQRAVQIASSVGKVVNLLNVKVPAPPPQILLKVIFASVDRNKSTQLGMNLFSTGFGNTIGSISTGQFTQPMVDSTGAKLADDLNLMAFSKGLNLGATIKALEAKGLVQVLAEPNVLAEDGKQGSFLAGGEYPYPVPQGNNATGTTITVLFKEYGIRLNFIPTIMPTGDIRLQVAPEVSSLDFTHAIQISGFQIPAIAVRRVKTEVELSEGQSFAIGGLLDNREIETFQKVPFIGSIPILGKFFQSIDRQHTNTELIVIVTPEIVHPIPVGAPVPKPNYPGTFLPPNSTVPMHTPEDRGKGVGRPAPATIPMEKLVESLKPEAPLADVTGTMKSGAFAGDSGSSASASPQ